MIINHKASFIEVFLFLDQGMMYAYKLTLVFLFIIFDLNLKAEYEVINAFPALSFNDPVGIYHSGDGTDRIFVVEQPGIIKVFDNNPSSSEIDIFLDITNIVEQDGGYTEEGLLGLAFHPNYSENGYFYVNRYPLKSRYFIIRN